MVPISRISPLLRRMAYRRKQGNPRSSSTYEELRSPPAAADPSAPSSLAAQAIRASSAHRDSSLSSAYGESAFNPARRESADRQTRSSSPKDSNTYEYTSMKNLNENKYGFWGVFARKAKNIIEVENATQLENPNRDRPSTLETTGSQVTYLNNLCPETAELDNLHRGAKILVKPTSGSYHQTFEGYGKKESPKLQKGLGAITSSLNYFGGRVGNALEEGLQIVESRTADILQETRKLNIRRKGSGSNVQNRTADSLGQQNYSHFQTDMETQLKAARDVANAMAAKAKLLMRELKTVKADLAFAKERCAQLEEENRILRESNEKGDHPEDDDLVRLQLETLLAEKARLAHENSVYTRENRFLREIVEYHQLTMQDVIYLDEGIEEVTEVYPTRSPTLAAHGLPASPSPSGPSPTLSRTSTFNEPASHPIVPVPPAAILQSSSNTPSPTTLSPHHSFGRGGSTVSPVLPTQTTPNHSVPRSTGEAASAKVEDKQQDL